MANTKSLYLRRISWPDMALWRTSLTKPEGIWALIGIKHVQKECIIPFSISSLSQHPAGFPKKLTLSNLDKEKDNCYAIAFVMLFIWSLWSCLLPHWHFFYYILSLNQHLMYRMGIKKMQSDSKVLKERGNGIGK